MITKILFTVIIIVVVGMVFAKRSNEAQASRQAAKKPKTTEAEVASLSPQTLAYGLIGLLILISGVVYYFSWSSENSLVKLRLVGIGGQVTEYQAYKKDIKDRSFVTISGKQIRMADSDRLELLE